MMGTSIYKTREEYMIVMDTHRAVEKIMVAGLSKEAAEAIVDTVNNGNDDLVTKKDLSFAISELKGDILKWILSFFLGIVALNITTIGVVVSFLGK